MLVVFFTILSFSLSNLAHADDSVAADYEAPAVDVEGEGTLWDYIEVLDGEVPTEEAVEESDELSEERAEEVYFLGQGTDALEKNLAWYADPKGIAGADPYFLDQIDPTEFDLPIVVNDDVVRWMSYFLGRGRKYFRKWYIRSGRYRPLISARLAQEGIPQDLVYLAMIESGFSTHAYSSASAVGLWQFIQSTGSMYGLRSDWWVDHRRDPVLATDAAARHLKDLYDELGDWYLAMCAYNAGTGRVKSAIRRGKTRDFWVMEQRKLLPSETMNYVPKILAAAIIGHNPERYGFVDMEMEAPLLQETIQVTASTPVAGMAKCAGLDEKEFRVYNPSIRRFSTPPTPEKMGVHVPPAVASSFSACVAKIPKEDKVAFQRHRVRGGETLASIGAKYGVSVSEIVNLNRIRNVNKIYVGQELVIPAPGGSGAQAASTSSKAKSKKSGKKTTHVVKSGETLQGIASKYKISPGDLMRWNEIANPNRLYVGQKLVMYGATSPLEKITVVIRRGDSLSKLAEKYGVSVADIQKWNNIANASKVRIGQKIVIYSGGGGWIFHKVKRGDSLGAIASKYGCSIAEIKSWNGISGTVIHPGQELKIRKK